MGYETRYKLSYSPQISRPEPCPHCGGTGQIVRDDVIACQLAALKGFDGYPINSNLDQPVKWYQHETDMKMLSAMFPDVLFTLRGEGSEAGDVWVKYFKGGKVQESKAKIQVEEFDEAKLK